MALSELTDPTAVRRAMAEFDEEGRDAFLEKYGFRQSRNYVLRENGRDYDSKAIVGAAFGFQFPDRGPMRPEDFTGGENTVQPTLERLGFKVRRLNDPWSREEIELAVADYLDMLGAEGRGDSYDKTEHRARLMPLLKDRSKGSVEFKHQNISAVLDEFELPFIRGYPPRKNVQKLLREIVKEKIQSAGALVVAAVDAFELVRPPNEPNYDEAAVEPPMVDEGSDMPARERLRIPKKIDYVARDERNRGLGRAGEEWALAYERRRLTKAGRADLAARVRWVSDQDGDGAGHDIASFDIDGSERFIEVKTTNSSATTSFVLTASELEFSREKGAAFALYRIYDFNSMPRMFELSGDLSEQLRLQPMDFRARLKANTR